MRKLHLIAVALLLVAMLSCSTDTTGPAAPNSGEMTTFGIPEEAMNLLLNPPMEPENSEYAGWPFYPDSIWDVYSVRILWGNLANDVANSVTTTDWSGRLSVEMAEAFVRVTSEIDFEDEDSVLIHDAVHFAAWVSKTAGDFDGLAFQIYVRKGPLTVIPMLDFHTTPFSFSIGFDQLNQIDTVFHVDNIYSVSLQARKLPPSDCPHGKLHGNWVFKYHWGGYFEGKWMDVYGHHAGYLAAGFWTTPDGERKFAGFWFDPVGAHLGRLWGTWGFTHNTAVDLRRAWPIGHFRGHFSDRNDRIMGSLGGEFGPPSADAANTVLTFRGRWGLHCGMASLDDSD